MNPLTGGAHYLEIFSKKSSSSNPTSKPRLDLNSVVFSENSVLAYDQKSHEEERQKRLQEIQKKQESYMKRREANVLKEAGRWQAAEEDYKKSYQKLEVKRSKWKAGQKNNPSEAFNVITLDYEPTHQGEYLKKIDEEKKYREGLRLYNLDSRMNSGFNIITGAARQPPKYY
jgi:hypothetical protein